MKNFDYEQLKKNFQFPRDIDTICKEIFRSADSVEITINNLTLESYTVLIEVFSEHEPVFIVECEVNKGDVVYLNISKVYPFDEVIETKYVDNMMEIIKERLEINFSKTRSDRAVQDMSSRLFKYWSLFANYSCWSDAYLEKMDFGMKFDMTDTTSSFEVYDV